MSRIIISLLLCTLLSLSLGSPVDDVMSVLSRQTRRDRKPIEDRLIMQLATNGATLGRAVRGTPIATVFIIRLFNRQRTLSAEISQIRADLHGPNRVRGRARRQLILDEDILIVQTFLTGLKIERALKKRPNFRGPARRTLRTQRSLAIDLINARFGIFTV